MPDDRPAALTLRDVTHRFGATRALDGASLVVRRGTLHAVLGENGAGKTTLVRCAFGLVRPDAGRLELDGAPYAPATPADALRHGVGMVHQHFTLVPAMTVAENVALGGRGRFDRRRAANVVRELGERTGLRVEPDARVRDLPVGAQQRVEILKALVRGARLLILDEPSAVLVPDESVELNAWLRRYVSEGNTAVVVTHKLREALATADDVTVLRHGRTVLAAPARELDEHVLLGAMLGTAGRDAGATELATVGAAPEHERRPAAAPGRRVPDEPASHGDAPPAAGQRQSGGTAPVVLRADALRLFRADGSVAIHDASLAVRAGEIVGIAGVENAGQRELLRALAGRLAPDGGTLALPARVGFVPEDRHRDALILDFTLAENAALAEAGRGRGRAPWRALRERAARLLERHDVRPAVATLPAWALSGGNQQKLVLARELETGAPALVLENPTRGLDVRAAAAVHARLRAAREAGVAVVVYASDLDEVLALADRMLVVHAGRVREVPREREAVGRAMVGA